MQNIKIVADSSSNILSAEKENFAYAPLKICSAEREFIDSDSLNVEEMAEYFDAYKGASHTSCPNPEDWLTAFGDAENIICVTMTSGMSGTHNAACIAKATYEEAHPCRRVYVLDSLSAGPEIALILEKLEEYIGRGLSFDEICKKIENYRKTTGILFMLKSMKNLANNGRVSHVTAKLAGLMGIHIIGTASAEGTLEPIHKCRGESKSLDTIVAQLKEFGLKAGKVRIDHCMNELAALQLKERILTVFRQAKVEIGKCRGLCSFYAEKGGLIIGFECF